MQKYKKKKFASSHDPDVVEAVNLTMAIHPEFMKWFNSEPFVIEAMKLTVDNECEIMKWMNNDPNCQVCRKTPEGLLIKSLEPEHTVGLLRARNLIVEYGDYVVKEIKGEFCPFGASAFELMYEKCE